MLRHVILDHACALREHPELVRVLLLHSVENSVDVLLILDFDVVLEILVELDVLLGFLKDSGPSF